MENNKEINKLQKNLSLRLLISIILTVMFPLGIAMTVIGATRKEDGGAVFTAIMAIGIVFVVLGFYGAPMSWVTYAPKKKYARIIDAIKREGFRDATEIANHLSMQPNEVIDAVRVCIDKQYLTNYTIEETKLSPSTIVPTTSACTPFNVPTAAASRKQATTCKSSANTAAE